MTVKKQSTGKASASVRTVVSQAPKSGKFAVKASFNGVSAKVLAGSPLTQSPRKATNDYNKRAREMNTEIRAKTSLKPAGGSLVMTVPAVVRKALGYTQGTELAVSVDDGKMIIEAVEPAKPALRVRRPKYTLDELLNDTNSDTPMTDEERAWQNAAPVGREIW
jgi:antitoxin ChpS